MRSKFLSIPLTKKRNSYREISPEGLSNQGSPWNMGAILFWEEVYQYISGLSERLFTDDLHPIINHSSYRFLLQQYSEFCVSINFRRCLIWGVLVKHAMTHNDPQWPKNRKLTLYVDRARRDKVTTIHNDPTRLSSKDHSV